MEHKMPSIRDVATRANVSTATVSNVLNGKKPVSEELVARVRQAAEELGYTANRAASQLRSGKTNVVGVLVPDLSDPFFTSIITKLEELAWLGGYEIVVANSNDSPEVERGRLNALLEWRPAGMVVVPCKDVLPEVLMREKDTVPFVIADRAGDSDAVDNVQVDNVEAGRIAAKYLAEIGHRDLVLASSDMNLVAIRQRCLGAVEAMKAAGGRARIVELGADPERGAEALTRWLERNDPPTALFAVTDVMTLAALTCLARRKTDIPDQISVIGFDDFPWMSARRTALTAVGQPVSEYAQAIWACLSGRMNGDKQPQKKVVLNCTLEIRDSAKAIPVVRLPEDKTQKEGYEDDGSDPVMRSVVRRRPDALH